MATNPPATDQDRVDDYNAWVDETHPEATGDAIFGPPAERRYGPFPNSMTGRKPSSLQEPFINQQTGQPEATPTPQLVAPESGLFEGVKEENEPEESASLFSGVGKAVEESEYTTGQPTNTLAFLTTLARTDPNKDTYLQLTREAIEQTYELLGMREEHRLRNILAARQQQDRLLGLQKLVKMLGPTANPEYIKATTEAYNNILNWDMDRRARISIEEEAIDRIQQMAVTDPVQAKVLFDNFDKGGAEERIRDFQIRMAVLSQRAEEYEQDYQAQGWDKTVFNWLLNVVPINYNFARSGIVGEGSFAEFLQPGKSLQNQNAELLSMPMDDFIEYTKKGGEFDQRVRSNGTTIFGMTADPAMRAELIKDLTVMTDSARKTANLWGAVEVASVVPWVTLGRVTKSLARVGNPKAAADNLANHLDIMDKEGPEAATRMTGIVADEVDEELAVSSIRPQRPLNEVPYSEQVAARREAAQKLFNEEYLPAILSRARTPEELAAAVKGTTDELTAQVGRPIKDVRHEVEVLPGGATVNYITAVIGKADGHGYATTAGARNAARKSGLAGEPVEVVTTTQRIVDPKEGFNFQVYHGTPGATVGRLRESTGGAMGPGLYVGLKADVANAYAQISRTGAESGANVLPLLVRKEKIFGIDNIDGYTLDEAYRFLDEVGIDRASFDEWKSGQNIESLADEASFRNDGKIDSMTIHNDAVRFLERQSRAASDDVDDFISGETIVNTRLQEKGWEGLAIKMYNHDQAVIFDAGNAVNKLEPVEVFQETSGQHFARVRKNIAEAGWLQDELHPPAQGFLSKMFGRYVRSTSRISDATLHGRSLEVGSRLNRAHKWIAAELQKNFKNQPVVRAIATLGAKRERWFSPEEFDELVQRQYGRRATESEQAAYARFQLLNDVDFELRNTAVYVNKVYDGQESATFTTKWGQDFDVDAKIDYTLDNIPTERVYDASRNIHYTKQNNPLTREQLEKMKGEGYVMLKLSEPMTLPEGIKTNLVFLKKSDIEIKPLRREQIPYSPGGHRMYPFKGYIKQGRKGTQSDTGAEYLEAPATLRGWDNIADGKAWADTMNRARLALKENSGLDEAFFDDVIFKHDPAYPTGREFLDQIEDGTINLDNPFEAVWDRELPSMYQQSGEDISRLYDEDELGVTGYYRTTGRMYTSAKGEILRNTKGEIADIIDPYDTLKTSLEQVTRQIGLQNYRIEATNRFKNTYAKYLDIQPNHKSPVQVLTEAKVRPDVPLEIRNTIEAQRDAITNVLRFETPADKAARQRWQSTAEWVIGSGDNAARRFAHDALWWWKERNPVSAIRGYVFDMKLGMFNPGQLLIQISTMVSATALSPKFGMQGMASIPSMHAYLLKKGSENVLDTLSKRSGVWKAAGFDSAEEFKEYARHMYLHGFPDMNGAHVMIGDYGPNSHFGSFGEKVQNLRETGRVFFYTAETYNRLVAWRIAYGELKKRGMKATDMGYNEEMLRLADDYSMNMTGESAAYWQKGVLSIPTQFWAYNVRMLDAMLGKRFTPAQRIRLALANLGMAGTAGIPGLGALSTYLKDKEGAAPSIESLEGVLDRGLIDYINYNLSDEDIMIGERIGTGGWVTETARALFGQSEYGERSFIDIVGGASYSIAKKTAEGGVATLGALAAYAAAESGSDMGESAIAQEKLLTMFKEISTFGNATKAMLVHQHGMYKSNKGSVIASDLPPGNAVYIALSFRPAKAEEISHLMNWETNKRESIKEVATQLRNWRQEAFNNPDKFQENMQKANALIRLLPVTDRREVIKRTNSITDKSFYDHIEKKVREEKAREQMAEGIPE